MGQNCMACYNMAVVVSTAYSRWLGKGLEAVGSFAHSSGS